MVYLITNLAPLKRVHGFSIQQVVSGSLAVRQRGHSTQQSSCGYCSWTIAPHLFETIENSMSHDFPRSSTFAHRTHLIAGLSWFPTLAGKEPVSASSSANAPPKHLKFSVSDNQNSEQTGAFFSHNWSEQRTTKQAKNRLETVNTTMPGKHASNQLTKCEEQSAVHEKSQGIHFSSGTLRKPLVASTQTNKLQLEICLSRKVPILPSDGMPSPFFRNRTMPDPSSKSQRHVADIDSWTWGITTVWKSVRQSQKHTPSFVCKRTFTNLWHDILASHWHIARKIQL